MYPHSSINAQRDVFHNKYLELDHTQAAGLDATFFSATIVLR